MLTVFDRFKDTRLQKVLMGTLDSHILRFVTESPSKVTFKRLRDAFCNDHQVTARDLKRIIAKLVASEFLCYTSHYGRSFIELSYDKPILVSDHIIIKPTRSFCAASANQWIISLERGAAFGGGEHPTTRLAVQIIDDLLHKPYWRKKKHLLQALDIGTGSGVLAVVAAKMGVGSVCGIDTDPCSVHEAKENICANHLDHRVSISSDDLNDLPNSYDLVFANLRTPTLIAIHENINKKTTAESVLVFSGLKSEEAALVYDCYQTVGFKVLENRKEKGWGALCLIRGAFSNDSEDRILVY